MVTAAPDVALAPPVGVDVAAPDVEGDAAGVEDAAAVLVAELVGAAASGRWFASCPEAPALVDVGAVAAGELLPPAVAALDPAADGVPDPLGDAEPFGAALVPQAIATAGATSPRRFSTAAAPSFSTSVLV
ncbi:MAG TPA: hypothetical protein VFU35_14385, partial [Jatrophihabitans sp.]|nr:hypothetical protein [Jatrophihabitans sp.]